MLLYRGILRAYDSRTSYQLSYALCLMPCVLIWCGLFTRLLITTIKSFETFKLGLYRLSSNRREPSKNRRMPQCAVSTRYSLVKGERIVRSVITAWLLDFVRCLLGILKCACWKLISFLLHVGLRKVNGSSLTSWFNYHYCVIFSWLLSGVMESFLLMWFIPDIGWLLLDWLDL